MPRKFTKLNNETCPYNINLYKGSVHMDKPAINEKLIASYEVDFGKGKTKVCEYSPSLTKDEIELNQMTVKNIHAKVFGRNEN